MPIPISNSIDVSETPLDIEIMSRTPDLTYAIARQRRARGPPYTYHFRIEKARLYYQFVLPPKTVRKEIIKHLKYMNIRAYDAGLRERKIEKHIGLSVE